MNNPEPLPLWPILTAAAFAVLPISLSMIELDYFTWLRKSAGLFALNFLLVLGFIVLGVAVGY